MKRDILELIGRQEQVDEAAFCRAGDARTLQLIGTMREVLCGIPRRSR